MRLSFFASSRLGALTLVLSACGETTTAVPAPQGGDVSVAARDGELVDRAIAAVHMRLLDLAFDAACKLPENPHRKNRSRLQAMLVDTCLDLDLPVKARALAERIAGWERGHCYAELAYHCVRRQLRTDVDALLTQALRLADEAMTEEAGQVWRRDRIRARVAAVHLLRGEADKAQALQQDLTGSEVGAVAEATARTLDPAKFDQHLRALDEILANKDVDRAKAALQTCVQLFVRFGADADKRARLLDRVENAFPTLPLQMRIEFVVEVADAVKAHGDASSAISLLDSAGRLVARKDWVAEDQIALGAKVATHRARAGDMKGARQALLELLDAYGQRRDTIVDVFRGAALRPIAEGLVACGATSDATQAYRWLVEEGVHNPNSRPRVEDLARTCASMARSGFLPDEALQERLAQISKGLGDPW